MSEFNKTGKDSRVQSNALDFVDTRSRVSSDAKNLVDAFVKCVGKVANTLRYELAAEGIALILAIVVFCLGIQSKNTSNAFIGFSIAFIVVKAMKAVFLSIGKVYVKDVKREIKNLRKENQRLSLLNENIELTFEAWLMYLLKRVCSVGIELSDCRASFYLFNDKGGSADGFRFVARESTDPIKKRKGREEFPSSEGVIGDAWRSSSCKEISVASQIRYAAYREYVVSAWGFTQKVANQLTMESHYIVGMPVFNVEKRKVGVVVFESESLPKASIKKSARHAFKDAVEEISPHVSKLLSSYSDYVFCQEEEGDDEIR